MKDMSVAGCSVCSLLHTQWNIICSLQTGNIASRLETAEIFLVGRLTKLTDLV
jgi:hypothetical protein